MTTFDTSTPVWAGSDNAARRPSYQGAISLAGMAELKQAALARLPTAIAQHHSDGRFHIHDLDALGRAPNCLTVDFRRCFPTPRLRSLKQTRRLLGIFDFLRLAIANIGADQSGGIGFANIDDDIAWACDQLSIPDSSETRDLLKAGMAGFIDWVNTTRTRYGLECYYVTLNIGLSLEPLGRHVAACLLDSLRNAPASYVRPNVVFKVRTSLHRAPTASNRAILDSALATTALRMVPTYLLCDAEPNADIPSDRLAIMGCRTRVAANVHGPTTAIGRGNLAYISVNLPRLAWHASSACSAGSQRLEAFGRLWRGIAVDMAQALLIRRRLLEELPATLFPGYRSIDPWLEPFSDGVRVNVWRHGTLSIGFVGLAEAVEILTGERLGVDASAQSVAIALVSGMRNEVDRLRADHNSNLTLLATSAESAAGRFARLDWAALHIPQAEKGFYTNSFHVPVDVPLDPIQKLRLEAPFHRFCNGGCISYVELSGPPLGNPQAIEDMLDVAAAVGVSYFGVNFPRDICSGCGREGIFDVCPGCSSSDVAHIRRVSGYLEQLHAFTPGKHAEVARRLPHARGQQQCQ